MGESGFSFSGLLQGVAATGLGYLDRRLDVDLDRRLATAQVPAINTPVPLQPQASMFGLPAGLLPLLLVGVVAIVLLRK